MGIEKCAVIGKCSEWKCGQYFRKRECPAFYIEREKKNPEFTEDFEIVKRKERRRERYGDFK
jgi:hypothetical protein